MSGWDYESKDFGTLVGKTIVSVSVSDDEKYTDELIFTMDDGCEYKMYHSQDCCESVYIQDVTGSWDDIIGEKILYAREETADAESEWGDAMWTFYHIGTFKGTVCLRWLGESNGYYSISVSFIEYQKPEPQVVYEVSFIDILDMTESDKIIYKHYSKEISTFKQAAVKFICEEHPYKTDKIVTQIVQSVTGDNCVFSILDIRDNMVFVRVVRTVRSIGIL